MVALPVITQVGNLTADPELRFTQSGIAVASFSLATTPRRKNQQTDEWEDGETLFMRCTVWREYAEHVAESLTRGMNVMVHGQLKQRSYETKEGEKRTVIEMDCWEVGPLLRWATAKVNRITRGNQQPGPSGMTNDDPWGTAPPGGGSAGFSDDPPF